MERRRATGRRIGRARPPAVRRLVLGAVGLLAFLVPLLAGAGPAWADDGLTMASDSTFTYDPAGSVVRVAMDVTVRNVTTDQRDGNVIRRAYYSGFSVPVPAAATAVTATDDGVPLEVTVTPAGERVARADVAFAANLFSGRSRTVTVAYELRGDEPRTEGFVRVNPAYASFVAYGAGDPGEVTVRVVVPSTFVVETLGDPVQRRVEGTTFVYTAEAIAEPERWFVAISARDDEALERTDVMVGDRPMTIAAWPGDQAWAAFVRRNLDDGVPALERLIGQPWPLTDRLSIVESVTPYLRGYGGWFLASQRVIEVGEDLDDRILLHELSHAWFNRDLFAPRWINEGMAEEFSARALGELGRPVPAPDPVDPDDPDAVVLEEWSAPERRDDEDDTEAWGYNASWSVVNQLTAEIGVDGMARVIAAAADGTPAYLPDEPATLATNDWRRFLDLLEERGGATGAEELFRSLVVPADAQGELDERRAARARLADVAEAGGEWVPPIGIRRALEDWDFDRATARADDAVATLARRDELAAAAAAASLVPVPVESDYEAAEDGTGEVRADLDRQLAAVGAITTARARVAEPRSFVERVGLWGRTPEEELAAAAAAFATDDTAAAEAAARRAVAQIDTANDLGRRRVTRAGAASGAGVLVLAGGTVVGVRARRRRRAARAQEAIASVGPAGAAEVRSDGSADDGPGPIVAPVDDTAPVGEPDSTVPGAVAPPPGDAVGPDPGWGPPADPGAGWAPRPPDRAAEPPG